MTPSPAKQRYDERIAAGKCCKHPNRPLETKTLCHECAAGYRARRKNKARTYGSLLEIRTKWAAVDWSKTNREIAIEMGCDPSLANYHRKKIEA